MEESRNDSVDDVSVRDLILSLKELWQFLLSKWFKIFLAGLLGAVFAYGYAVIKKIKYTATTSFVLEAGDGNNAMGQYSGIASMIGIDLAGSGGGIFQGDNILELYRSRTMIQKALLSPIDSSANKLLVDLYIENNDLRKAWANKPELKSLKFSSDNSLGSFKQQRLRDSILSNIVSDINKNQLVVSKLDKKLSIIVVDVKSKSEVFAKVFNDILVKNVNEFYIQTKTKKSLQNVAILTDKTDSVRNVMNGAIFTAVKVADETPNFNPTRQVKRQVPVQKAQFNAETNKTVLGMLIQNLEMAKMSLLKETPLLQIVDAPIYPLKNDKPNKIIFMFFGAIIGSFLFTFYITIKRFLNKQLKKA